MSHQQKAPSNDNVLQVDVEHSKRQFPHKTGSISLEVGRVSLEICFT